MWKRMVPKRSSWARRSSWAPSSLALPKPAPRASAPTAAQRTTFESILRIGCRLSSVLTRGLPAGRCAKRDEPPHRFLNRLRTAREMEAQSLTSAGRIVIEARARNRRYPTVFDQSAGKRDVVRFAETRDVGHHVVGPAGPKRAKARLFQTRDQKLAPDRVILGQRRVITLLEL